MSVPQFQAPVDPSGLGTASITWQAVPNATGYNVYRLKATALSECVTGSGVQLVGSSTTTNFTDSGSGTPQNQNPPSSSYGYDPLSTYYTKAIQDFFNKYTAASSFSIILGTTTWTGNTTTYKGYTVLQLTGTDSSGGGGGGAGYVYQPLFSTNTNNSTYPAPPSWIVTQGSQYESPGRMVFACDGVFASGGLDPNSAATISNVENPICAALNRGIASSLAPTSWANAPSFVSATAQSGGGLAAGTYYYVMTALDAGGNESTPSFEWKVSVDGVTNQSVALQWLPLGTNVVSAFKIYRGPNPGKEATLVTTITNNGAVQCSQGTAPQQSCFVDTGAGGTAQSPPNRYYDTASGAPFSYYSKFLHQDSSTDPSNGISIHSLVYGFPYDDQGNASTNIGYTGVPNSVTFTFQPWTTP